MKNYYSVSEAVNDPIERSYTIDFTTQAHKNCQACHRTSIQLPSDDFQINEIHRFQGNTGPEDEMIVFAIPSPDHHVKGIVINAYGMYAERMPASVMEDFSLVSN